MVAKIKAKKPRDTYKYIFKVKRKHVHGGVTTDLSRRESEHKQRWGWGSGHISQVGRRTTRERALQWERDNGYQANCP